MGARTVTFDGVGSKAGSLGLDVIAAFASADQAITASAASTNVLDFGLADPNKGEGEPLEALVFVTEAFAATGAATLDITIQDCNTEGGSYVNIASAKQYGKAALVPGVAIAITLPAKHRRYVGLYYTVGTGPMTAGRVQGYLVAHK